MRSAPSRFPSTRGGVRRTFDLLFGGQTFDLGHHPRLVPSVVEAGAIPEMDTGVLVLVLQSHVVLDVERAAAEAPGRDDAGG